MKYQIRLFNNPLAVLSKLTGLFFLCDKAADPWLKQRIGRLVKNTKISTNTDDTGCYIILRRVISRKLML